MEKLYDIYERYRDYILFLVLFITMVCAFSLGFWYFYNEISDVREDLSFEEKSIISDNKIEDENKIFVDIKGEVKKPGVYSLDNSKRVIDAIKKAGGFTKNADSSVNNLSLKLTDEMVIIVYSKDEISDYLSVKEKEDKSYEICKSEVVINDSCVNNKNNDTSLSSSDSKKEEDKSSVSEDENTTSDGSSNKLISINTATKEELMNLPSIGESKALAIIEYRKKQKFNTIEEIKNVSGIGDALFEKIKDFITT